MVTKKSVVKIALTAIVVLFGFAFFLMLASTVHAAEAAFKWEHFGADPYAVTREEGMRTREDAFRKLGLPEAVVTELMTATDASGEKIRLVNGTTLDAMLSKGGVVHKNVTVAFIKPPVNGKMEYAAPAEKWQVTSDGKTYVVILPEVCNNWSSVVVSVTSQPVVPVPALALKPIAGGCPNVYTLKVNVWEKKVLSLPEVERTHAKEELAKKELENRFVGVPHVSRTHGGQFRKAWAAGDIKRSTVTHGFRVSLIMTPESSGGVSLITKEEILSDIQVSGLYELRFTRAQLDTWDAIRLVPLEDGGIISPPRSGITGLHELRYFNREPGKPRGEWEDNPVLDCIMNEHWIEQ